MRPVLPSRIRPLAYVPAGRSPILEMTSVAVARDGVDILHDVSLTLHAGEIYGLLGPNGAGKSTTIAAALGLLPRRAGTIAVFGRDPAIDGREIQERVGLLPERLGSLDCMTAAEYLSYFARLHRDEPDRSDIDHRLEIMGLEPRAESAIGTYSRGMQQRLGIARALIADPELLILEHPTDGLDPDARRQLHELLRTLATRRGIAILLCTHLLDEAERLCSRVGVLVRGRTIVEGRISELQEILPCMTETGLSAQGAITAQAASDVTSVSHDLLAAGWPTMEVAESRRGLEQLYLEAIQRAALGAIAQAGAAQGPCMNEPA